MKCLVIILITVSLAWTMPLDQDPENTEDMINGKSIYVASFLYNRRLISQPDRNLTLFSLVLIALSKLSANT